MLKCRRRHLTKTNNKPFVQRRQNWQPNKSQLDVHLVVPVDVSLYFHCLLVSSKWKNSTTDQIFCTSYEGMQVYYGCRYLGFRGPSWYLIIPNRQRGITKKICDQQFHVIASFCSSRPSCCNHVFNHKRVYKSQHLYANHLCVLFLCDARNSLDQVQIK